MTPRWAVSADKHRVARSDAVHALLHSTWRRVIHTRTDGTLVRAYIGPPHAWTSRELEVLVDHPPPETTADAVVFHVMPLGAKYRRMREEFPHGDRRSGAARTDRVPRMDR